MYSNSVDIVALWEYKIVVLVPCAIIFSSLVRLFIFENIPALCVCRLIHTVRLLDTPEYITLYTMKIYSTTVVILPNNDLEVTLVCFDIRNRIKDI